MNWAALLLITLSGFLIIRQDFSSREISWYLLPLMAFGMVLLNMPNIGLAEYMLLIISNVIILVIILGVVGIYYCVKAKALYNFIDKKIGLGDLLFFMILCLGFSPINFVVFFLIGLLLTLIFHLINTAIRPQANVQIPLAGCLSILLIIISWMQYPFMILNMLDDKYLIKII